MTTPRIYTYKITFEEVPYWYWGVHKEKKYGETYLGSPVTHKWMWNFYTPKIQILETFPCTDEGWEDAKNVERRIILPDLNNPLCLNEHCGRATSLEIRRRTGKRMFKEGEGIHSPESRKKQREMMIGREVSEVTRNRLSEAMRGNTHCLGKVHTVETKQKIALAVTGNQNRLGMSHSEETKEKIAASQRGRTFTEEHRRKLSEAARGKKRGPYKKRDKND